MSGHDTPKGHDSKGHDDVAKSLAAVDESIQIALSAAGTATDAAQELQRLRLQVTSLIEGSKRSGMVLLYSGIIVLIIAGVILVGSILFYQRSLARFEAITSINREALLAIAGQIKTMGEVAHNLEEATAATGQSLIAVTGREEDLRKSVKVVLDAQAALNAKIENLTMSNDKIPGQIKQALDDAAKQANASNAQVVDTVKAQMNAFSAAEVTRKLDNILDAQKSINSKVPKPETPAAAARNKARARDNMDSGIRYP
jgi:hypothetical protein